MVTLRGKDKTTLGSTLIQLASSPSPLSMLSSPVGVRLLGSGSLDLSFGLASSADRPDAPELDWEWLVCGSSHSMPAPSLCLVDEVAASPEACDRAFVQAPSLLQSVAGLQSPPLLQNASPSPLHAPPLLQSPAGLHRPPLAHWRCLPPSFLPAWQRA